MILFFVFIFGLIIGSFLNAVIFRLHNHESFLFERSHCMHCKHELSGLDLVPLFSFLALKGRCRYCHKKISWQYPLIELLTAIVFVLLALNYQNSIFDIHFVYSLVISSFLIVVAVYDFKHMEILDKVIYPALGIATIYNLAYGHLVQGLIGAAIVTGFFAAQYFVSKGRWIGFGDVKFGLLLGSLFGVKMSIIMLVIAYFLGAVVGVSLLASGKKKLSSELPFGVFLSISAIIMIVWGTRITEWYFNLIGL